jgi:hypothetical protein
MPPDHSEFEDPLPPSATKIRIELYARHARTGSKDIVVGTPVRAKRREQLAQQFKYFVLVHQFILLQIRV